MPAANPARLRALHRPGDILITLMIAAALFVTGLCSTAWATGSQGPNERIQGLIPEIESYIDTGMKSFDVPGLAIGIVANDQLVYARGFYVRSKSKGESVDTHTVLQIGSITKASRHDDGDHGRSRHTALG